MKNTNEQLLVKKQDNLKEDYLIVKSNILTEAKLCKYITLTEYRLLLIAMSKISPLANDIDYIYFKSDDFCKLLNIGRCGMYQYIKKKSQNLASRTVTIEDKEKKEWVTFAWLEEVRYVSGLIKIKFHKNLKPHILNIRKSGGYTKYFIKNVLLLNSKHDIRIYEMMKQYEKLHVRTFELQDFRERIGATNKTYNRMCDFRRLLNKSKENINVCTDIIYDFEEIKEGRKTTNLKFYIQSKNISKSDDYSSARKDIIILKIQNYIHRFTGYIFEAYHMNDIHRQILIDLLKRFESNNYNNLNIYNPESFFLQQINDIQNNYNMPLLEKKIKDY